MILSDTLNQPKALAIYAILGVIFGFIYALNYFACAYIIKSPIFRHVSQTLYVVAYGAAFFLTTYAYFDYDLKIYHALICLFFTTLAAIALYLLIRKHNTTLTVRCNALRTRISQSKLAKKFKK